MMADSDKLQFDANVLRGFVVESHDVVRRRQYGHTWLVAGGGEEMGL
jgi:hypothetical protein